METPLDALADEEAQDEDKRRLMRYGRGALMRYGRGGLMRYGKRGGLMRYVFVHSRYIKWENTSTKKQMGKHTFIFLQVRLEVKVKTRCNAAVCTLKKVHAFIICGPPKSLILELKPACVFSVFTPMGEKYSPRQMF